MKRLMDLYTCYTEQLVESTDKVKSVSRVILKNNGRFEGVKTNHENQAESFIFGRVEDDSIEVYDMPLNSNETLILKGSIKDYKYTGTYELLIDGFRIDSKQDCEIIMSDGDMTREVQEDEISFVINETKKAKRTLPADKKDIYNSYVSKFKNDENKNSNPYAIKK